MAGRGITFQSQNKGFILFEAILGKSLLLRTITLKEALETPNLNILYLLPTIKMAKNIAFRPLALVENSVIPKEYIREINKTDLTIELINGSRIVCAGTEALDRLRGFTVDVLILDEYAFMDEEVLAVLEPVVSARNGRIVVCSTPKGKNHFYEIIQKGLKGSGTYTSGYRSWVIPITDERVVLPNKELRIQNAMATLSKTAFDQEYLVSFSSAQGLVYSSYSTNDSVSLRGLDKDKALFIGLDLNVAFMCAVVGQRFVNKDGIEELHIVDEVVQYDTTTEKMAQEINRRYQQWKGKIFVYPDASGAARKTSSSQTDHLILQNAGLVVKSEKANPLIVDRVNTVNSLFQTADGRRRLFVNNNCTTLIRSLTSQLYDKKTNQPEKGSGHSDLSGPVDSLGYLVCGLYPMRKSQPQVIHSFGR